MQKHNIIFILLLYQFLFSQEIDISRLVREIESGDIDRANILLMSAEKDNPNSINIKYLKALLSKNADEAVKLYREVIHSNIDSEWKDDAVYRTYLYHYARGEFNESDKYARMLIESFPESEYIARLNKKKRDVPRLQDSSTPEISRMESKQEQIPTFNQQQTIISEKFSIQVGAFSSSESARKFANQFSGYPTRIIQKNINGKNLFAVLVGEFDSKDSALIEHVRIKERFKIDGMIIKSE